MPILIIMQRLQLPISLVGPLEDHLHDFIRMLPALVIIKRGNYYYFLLWINFIKQYNKVILKKFLIWVSNQNFQAPSIH
jgi:hypothetical protein